MISKMPPLNGLYAHQRTFFFARWPLAVLQLKLPSIKSLYDEFVTLEPAQRYTV